MPESQHCLEEDWLGEGSLRSSPKRRSTLKLNFTLVEAVELVDVGVVEFEFDFGLKLWFICESLVDGSLFKLVLQPISLSTGSWLGGSNFILHSLNTWVLRFSGTLCSMLALSCSSIARYYGSLMAIYNGEFHGRSLDHVSAQKTPSLFS